ncbi:MAG: RNA polymerase sigma factor [Bradymonadia bacterium]
MKKRRSNEASDADLSRRALRGDHSAWRALVRRHTPMVYRLSARILGPGPEAEDACQEAFLKMHRALHQYDPTRPLAPWLGRITYHVCLKRLARVKGDAEATDPVELGQMLDERAASPERAAADREAGRIMQAALDTLSAQDRALITLRYVEGMTDVEVGEAVGMHRNTVRTRLFRARQALRKMLGPLFDKPLFDKAGDR